MLLAYPHGGVSPANCASPRVEAWQLIEHAADGADILACSYAHVIATYCNPGAKLFVAALGMDHAAFANLLSAQFPHFDPPPAWLDAQKDTIGTNGPLAEFFDLLQLLLDHAAGPTEHHRNVAHLVVAACMGRNHLWQDLGLPDRRALSALLYSHFPVLSEKNSGDMKWKKFFYRQLCEREGLNACRAPSCGACIDYAKCFDPED